MPDLQPREGTPSNSSRIAAPSPHSPTALVSPLDGEVIGRPIIGKQAAPALRPGQRVWLSTGNLPLHMESRKLTQRFIGPFRILKKVNLVTYCLFLPRSLKINPTFHVSLPNPVVSSPFTPTVRPPPPPQIIGGQPAYMVHQILDSRRVQRSL